jgi:hypothetical protein
MAVFNHANAKISLRLNGANPKVIAHVWRWGDLDVGDQAPIHGLVVGYRMTENASGAVPFQRPRKFRPHSVAREFPCRGPTSAHARAMMAD